MELPDKVLARTLFFTDVGAGSPTRRQTNVLQLAAESSTAVTVEVFWADTSKPIVSLFEAYKLNGEGRSPTLRPSDWARLVPLTADLLGVAVISVGAFQATPKGCRYQARVANSCRLTALAQSGLDGIVTNLNPQDPGRNDFTLLWPSPDYDRGPPGQASPRLS